MQTTFNLGIDIDGTVTCPTTFVPYLNQAFGKNLTYDDIYQYDLPPLLGVKQEEFLQWMQKQAGHIYKQAPAATSAQKVLTDWFNTHHLIYISARPPEHEKITCDWFQQQNIPYHQIELLGTSNKIERAKQLHINVFLEDRLDTANDLAEALNIPIILFDTPYNRQTQHQNVYRVRHWLEAQQELKNMYNLLLK